MELKKHIIDERTGLSYTLHGDYYLPDLEPPEAPRIGKYGTMRHNYRGTIIGASSTECC